MWFESVPLVFKWFLIISIKDIMSLFTRELMIITEAGLHFALFRLKNYSTSPYTTLLYIPRIVSHNNFKSKLIKLLHAHYYFHQLSCSYYMGTQLNQKLCGVTIFLRALCRYSPQSATQFHSTFHTRFDCGKLCLP